LLLLEPVLRSTDAMRWGGGANFLIAALSWDAGDFLVYTGAGHVAARRLEGLLGAVLCALED
jgi:hypothetical protein